MNKASLTVEALTWQPDRYSAPILQQLSTVFKEGGFYGILGPNGSGKTSLIRHLLRFLEVSGGEIRLDTERIGDFPRKKLASYLSFVPQNVNMEVDFTVYDIIAMGRTPYHKRLQGLSQLDREKIEWAMEVTGCTQLKERLFSYLSGGEAQRVLAARAIAQDTKYLILDEPVSHLDIRYQVELMETMKYLNEKAGKTIIAILHDLNLSAAYCKEIVLMKDGKIYAEGTIDEVLTKEHLKAVYEIDFEIYRANHENQRVYIPMMHKKEGK